MKNINLVKLEKLCKMQSGGTPSRKNSNYWENGKILWAKISDLENSPDGFIYNTEEKISSEGLKSINNRIFSANTLFLAMYGSVGKVAISKVEMSTNQAILGINVIDDEKLDLQYLKFWFNKTKEELLDKAVGVALKNISLGLVKDLEIPLPSLATQKAIAEKLDKADALRKKDQELLAQYDELAQSIFIEMFGDPVQNEMGWEVNMLNNYITRLVDVGSNGGNDWVSKNINMKDEEDYAIMIRTTNLSNNDFENNLKYVAEHTYNLFKKTKVNGDEIIMNKIGSAGDFWIMPKLNKPVSLGLNQLLFEFKDLDINFFKYYFTTDYGQKLIKSKLRGAITKSITKGAVRELEIYNVPLPLQTEFSEKIKNIELQKALVKRQAEQSEDLFQALLQESFSF